MIRKLSSAALSVSLGCLLACAFAHGQNGGAQSFAVADGQYTMKATYKFSDEETPVVDAGGTVSVSVKGGELAIAIPLRRAPIVARLTGNKLKGELQEAGASVEFSGEIVENDHVEGVFTGSLGARRVNGLWSMKLSKKEPNKRGTS
jgi:hypothetical protein